MTNPVIIRQPSVAEQLQPGIAPLFQALQQRQQLQQAAIRQQQQIAAQKQNAELNRALDVYATALKTPGASDSDVVKELEGQLGVSGLSKQLDTIRKRTSNERFRAFQETIGDFDQKTQDALMMDFALGQMDTPVEIRNGMFARMAPEHLGTLDQLRADELREKIRLLKANIRAADLRAPTLQTQQRIAESLDLEFFPGVPYHDIFKTLSTQKDTDPRRAMLSIAATLMGQTDFLGDPVRTPAEAFQLTSRLAQGFFPGMEFSELSLTPTESLELSATRDAEEAYRRMLGEGSLTTEGGGKVVTRNERQRKRALTNALTSLYTGEGELDPSQIARIVDEVSGRFEVAR